MQKGKHQDLIRGSGLPHFDQRPSRFASDTAPDNQRPANVACPSWFTNGLQPSLVLIQSRVYASCLELVEPLPSPFVRLRLGCCSWQDSRREILEAKSPSLSSTVNVERRGKQGEQYMTGADGLYNGRSVSRQNQPPLRSRLRYGASALLPLSAFPGIGQF